MAGMKLVATMKSPTQMAVDSSCVPEQSDSVNGGIKSPKTQDSKSQKQSGGGGVCDSVSGKTCHQCRQKIRDSAAECKKEKKNKPCRIKICRKCLLNRYGEKTEEVANLADWSCPKCRGICNCSICMKRRGYQPTGQLVNEAKATGFSSVSEMLLKGPNRLNPEKVVPGLNVSPLKEGLLSPKKRGKENSFNGKIDENLFNSVEKKSMEIDVSNNGAVVDNSSLKVINQGPHKRLAEEGLKDMHVYKRNDGVLSDETSLPGKKSKISKCSSKDNPNVGNKNSKDTTGFDGKEKELKKIKKGKLEENGSFVHHKGKGKVARITADNEDELEYQTDEHVEVLLPLGTELTNVTEIDVPARDVGNALQFLEFCDVFGKVLGLKKGEAQCVLRDVSHGRARRGKFSLTVQFHINLIAMILDDKGEKSTRLSSSYGKNSWFHALKKCLSASRSIFTAEELDSLEKAADYDTLDAAQKLRVLNLLCDEVLGTEKLRKWIGNQNKKLSEKFKEAKQKMKDFKQKTNDDVAKTITATDGGSVSTSDYTAVNKSEEAKNDAKILEAKEILLKNSHMSDALRIEPIFIGRDGDAYWKLNCTGKSDILHQNVGRRDTPTLHEEWYAIDDEGKETIEKHVGSLCKKRQTNTKRRKVIS